MSTFKLTKDQELAVNRRSSLLVSAAAGSGKTRVLTQRLINRITDSEDPCSIDEFLVITFTRAAAGELKSRIKDQLNQLAAENPSNRRLRRQADMCAQAKIGTIHSFCARILKENSQALSIPPDFTTGDEGTCRRLKEKALERTLDAAYERINQDDDLALLVSGIGGGRDDRRLAKTVLELHDKIKSRPYPEKWVKAQISADFTNAADISQTPWGQELMKSARHSAEFWAQRMDELLVSISQDSSMAPLKAAYGESLEETALGLRNFLRALDRGWNAAREFLPIPFPKLNSLKNFEDTEKKASVTALRDACKKAAGRLPTIFDSPSEKLLEDLAAGLPSLRALLELTMDFDRRYTAEKRRAGLLDFSDLEHGALALLTDSNGDPTPLARELSESFREVLVDEYQDVNALQDLIFRSISQGGEKLFMVGDVKQSIYRFRLADPEVFLDRLSDLNDASDTEESLPAAVFLRQNFRSDRRILEACNSVFSMLMSPELGEINYDDNSALHPPETAPDASGEAKLYLLDSRCGEDEELSAAETEATFIAEKISELIAKEERIPEGSGDRPLSYGDIAVLMRSPGNKTPVYARVFMEMGIPVSSGDGNFFSAPETVMMISLLSVIDNPYQDIPLAALLTSPIFGFSSDMLAEIRTAHRAGKLYDAVSLQSAECERCRNFLNTLSELRSLSEDLGLRELLSMICHRLGLFSLFTAISGDRGTRCLMHFFSMADEFEQRGFRSLSAFLDRLDTMERMGHQPPALAGGGDAVTIMSVHGSKGLEFPVVFVADTSHKINKKELSAPVLIHSRLGIGCKVINTDRGIEYPSIAHKAIKHRLERELLSEELRILYVAMTRAVHRLYITCCVPKPSEKMNKLSAGLTLPPDPEFLASQLSTGSWLMTAAALKPDGFPDVEVVDTFIQKSSLSPLEEGSSPETEVPPDLEEKVEQLLGFVYPHEKIASIPAKVTATSLPSPEDGADGQHLAPAHRSFSLPVFHGEQPLLTGAERGVAAHTFLQFIDFDRTGSLKEIENELIRITQLGHLSPQQTDSIDRMKILNFFASPVGQKLRLSGENILREFRFSLLCPAEKFYPHAGEDKLLLQGVVDCCIVEEDGLILIDYKTDRISSETLEQTAMGYLPQLRAYTWALERITEKPVKKAILCFISVGMTKEFDPRDLI